MDRISVGDELVITATFRTNDAAATLTDPTTVSIRIRPPAGPTRTPVVTRLSAGVYEASTLADVEGNWTWSAAGTGVARAGHPGGIVAVDAPYA
jgi:hypothetical protein